MALTDDHKNNRRNDDDDDDDDVDDNDNHHDRKLLRDRFHHHRGFRELATILSETCRTTLLSLAPSSFLAKRSAGASITAILHRFRDLERFEEGTLYRILLERLDEEEDTTQRLLENEIGESDVDVGDDVDDDDRNYDDAPTLCSTVLESDLEDQQQPRPIPHRPPVPPWVRIDRRRDRAKRAFLSAVFIEATKDSAVEDLRETLRKHYVLGRNPFGYDEQIRDVPMIETLTIPDVLPPSSSSAIGGGDGDDAAADRMVVLYYYVF